MGQCDSVRRDFSRQGCTRPLSRARSVASPETIHRKGQHTSQPTCCCRFGVVDPFGYGNIYCALWESASCLWIFHMQGRGNLNTYVPVYTGPARATSRVYNAGECSCDNNNLDELDAPAESRLSMCLRASGHGGLIDLLHLVVAFLFLVLFLVLSCFVANSLA